MYSHRKRGQRELGIDRSQCLDDKVCDLYASRQLPRRVTNRVRLERGVEHAIDQGGGVVEEIILTTQITHSAPVENLGLGVHQGQLRLIGPISVTPIYGDLEGQVVDDSPRS